MSGPEYLLIAAIALSGGAVSFVIWFLLSLVGRLRLGRKPQRNRKGGRNPVTGAAKPSNIERYNLGAEPPLSSATHSDPLGQFAGQTHGSQSGDVHGEHVTETRQLLEAVLGLRADISTLATAQLGSMDSQSKRESHLLDELRGVIEALRPDLEARLARIEVALEGKATPAMPQRNPVPTEDIDPEEPPATYENDSERQDSRLVAMLDQARAAAGADRTTDPLPDTADTAPTSERTIRRG